MLRIYHIPRALGRRAGAGGHYGLKQMVKPELPDIGHIVFLLLSQRIDHKINLAQVKRIVLKRQLGIFDYRITFRARMTRFIVQLLYQTGVCRTAVRVEILLKQGPEIQMSIVLPCLNGLVALIFSHKFRIIIF